MMGLGIQYIPTFFRISTELTETNMVRKFHTVSETKNRTNQKLRLGTVSMCTGLQKGVGGGQVGGGNCPRDAILFS